MIVGWCGDHSARHRGRPTGTESVIARWTCDNSGTVATPTRRTTTRCTRPTPAATGPGRAATPTTSTITAATSTPTPARAATAATSTPATSARSRARPPRAATAATPTTTSSHYTLCTASGSSYGQWQPASGSGTATAGYHDYSSFSGSGSYSRTDASNPPGTDIYFSRARPGGRQRQRLGQLHDRQPIGQLGLDHHRQRQHLQQQQRELLVQRGRKRDGGFRQRRCRVVSDLCRARQARTATGAPRSNIDVLEPGVRSDPMVRRRHGRRYGTGQRHLSATRTPMNVSDESPNSGRSGYCHNPRRLATANYGLGSGQASTRPAVRFEIGTGRRARGKRIQRDGTHDPV